MTILVTGGRGNVGSYFERLAPKFDQPVECAGRDALDVTDLDQVRRVLASGPYRTIVNLAAATDLDRAEEHTEWAYRINALGAWNLALAANELDLELVQVSTVGMFGADGGLGPFSELDEPKPVNHYARTKLAGEQAVVRHCARHYVVRTAWVMGGGPKDKKFVGALRDRILRAEPIRAVSDKIGSPTYAHDLVLAIRDLLRTKAYGLYHVTNSGRASRFEIASQMSQILSVDAPIEPVDSSAFPLRAARPPSEASISYALSARGITLPAWRDALERYLAEWR
jgi:dTDP-4-dehydrorhamnose reductase